MPPRLAVGQRAEVASTSPEQRLFDKLIEGNLIRVASRLQRRDGPVQMVFMVGRSEELDLEGLKVVLRDKSTECLSKLPQSGLRGDFAIRFAMAQGCVYAVVKSCSDWMLEPEHSDYTVYGPFYVFNSADYFSKSKFRGKRFDEILAIVSREFGRDSQQFRQAERTVVVVRNLLFQDYPQDRRIELAKELRTLRESLGEPAGAIISHFIGNFESGVLSRPLGEIASSEVPVHAIARRVDDSLVKAQQPAARLIIGDINLRDLV